MSLQAAADELAKEIERLTKIRDSILVGITTLGPIESAPATQKTAGK